MRRIEAVEKDLKALSETSASKDDLSRIRAEVKKIYDGLHIGIYFASMSDKVPISYCLTEFLDLRSFAWGLRKFAPS